MDVIRYKPQAIVTFYTEKGELVARSTSDPKSKMDDDVIGIQTVRDMGADAPTFSINLTRRKHWHKWVASNDMVSIMMHRPPEAQATVFVGLVDDVRRRTAMNGDGVTRVVTVTGRGVAKSFIQFDIGIVPEAEYNSTSVGWLVSNGVMLSGSSAQVILETTWNNIAKKFVNYKWDNGRTLFSNIKYSFRDRPNMMLLDDSGIINYQGSLWAFMKTIAEEPFYELFWEIDEDIPTLSLRPTPFNSEDWNSLPIIEITDKEVISDNTGRSDVETHTLFSVGAKSFFSSSDSYKTFGTMPLWYEPYKDKYGIRRLHVETSYLAVAESTDVQSVDLMRALQVDLYNWNVTNNQFYNGTMSVMGSNKYKIGQRLLYTSAEDSSILEYYIKSVKQTFINYGTWITELGLTRGCNPKTRFDAPINSFTEYSGLGLVEYNPELAQQSLNEGGSPTAGVLPISGEYVDKSISVVGLAYEILNNGIDGVKVKYRMGGNNPATGDLDCSSFTQYVYKKAAGMEIGRTTGTQVTKGTKIDKSQLEPGDLLFFKNTYDSPHIKGVSHVGIYVSDNLMIHNSSSKSVSIISIDDKYWSSHYLESRRVLQTSSAVGTNFVATAYGANKINLGVIGSYVPTGKTATGTVPSEGRTIAVDPSVIPLHSKVRIESDYAGITGEYIAEDTGGAIKGNRIDIYFNDLPPHDPYKARERMLAFGKRTVKVTILRRGK